MVVIHAMKAVTWFSVAVILCVVEIPPVFDEAASWLIGTCLAALAVVALIFGLEEIENGIQAYRGANRSSDGENTKGVWR